MPREDGSASVEFAAVLPLAGLVLLLVIQAGLIAGAQLALVHAAREGARAAAVGTDEAARAAALSAGGLDPARTEVSVEPVSRAVGDPVTVRVSHRIAVVLPFVGRFVGEPTLVASVTMRSERDAP